MSVDIIYEKQFIDLKDGRYVPLLLSGSSNCYEYSSNGRERRARNWWLLTPIPRFEHFAPTLNEMLNMCDELRNDLQFQWDDYEDGSFHFFTGLHLGYKGGAMSFRQYQGLYKSGVKYALSIEQLRQLYCFSFSFRVSDDAKKSGSYKEYGIADDFSFFAPQTTKELVEFINLNEDALMARIITCNVRLPEDIRDFRDGVRRKYFPVKRKEKNPTKTNEFYVVEDNEGRFFVSFGVRRYFYC